VINFYGSATGRDDQAVEDGVPVFFQTGGQDAPNPGFCDISPETGRCNENDQKY
jgi:hypothetical protein